jgi:hypothetical protein
LPFVQEMQLEHQHYLRKNLPTVPLTERGVILKDKWVTLPQTQYCVRYHGQQMRNKESEFFLL